MSMNNCGTAGTYKGKIVYKYSTMFDYLSDVENYFKKDYYGLVDSTKLCFGNKQIGEVTWGRDGDNDVVIFDRPKTLITRRRTKDEVRVEPPIKMDNNIDIELMDIEDIIKEIRELKISFE